MKTLVWLLESLVGCLKNLPFDDFRMMKVAKKFVDANKSVYFAISNKNEFSHELTEFGIDSPSGDKPTIAGRDSKNQKFIMSGEFR